MGKKTVKKQREQYLDAISMSDGLTSELKAIVVNKVEPAIRGLIETQTSLVLSTNFNRESMASAFYCVRMPYQGGETSLGEEMANHSLRSLRLSLRAIKTFKDLTGDWADEEFNYLCECIDLLLYIERLRQIGDEVLYPEPLLKVFCKSCFRYAENSDIGSHHNLMYCHYCKEVSKDGSDYKKAQNKLGRYIDLSNKQAGKEEVTRKSIWMHLKKRQHAEIEGNQKIGDLRHIISEANVYHKIRYSAIIELINLMPRLKSQLYNDGVLKRHSTKCKFRWIKPGKVRNIFDANGQNLAPGYISANSLEGLIKELLVKMNYSSLGVVNFFQSSPEYFCTTLMRFDQYLILCEALSKAKSKNAQTMSERIRLIKDSLAAGDKVKLISQKTGCTTSYCHQLIRKHKLRENI